MELLLRQVVHISILTHHAFVGIYSMMNLNFKNSSDPELAFLYKYKYRYLTMWNLWAQSIYLVVSIAYDLQSSFIENNKYLKDIIPKLKSYVFISIIFPSAVFVSFTFWMLCNIDRELVFPKQIDILLPSWINHCIHTHILILPFVELLFNKKMPNYKLAFLIASLYYFIYLITVIYTYFETSKWIYKVFEVLNLPTRMTYMTFNYLLTLVAMHLAIIIQQCILKFRENKCANRISKKSE